MKPWCILTCEHASNSVPAEFRSVFQKNRSVLETHRGYDPGAKEMTGVFEQVMKTKAHFGEVSRLLIELNRSKSHPMLYSEFSQRLDPEQRQHLMTRYYLPYRKVIQSKIREHIERQQRVIHLSLHTFTPELHGEVRQADIGLLYDPRRSFEQTFCIQWQRRIQSAASAWRVRRNYPYQGKADGFTTALRRLFPPNSYLGIELEVNQKWCGAGLLWRQLGQLLAETFREQYRGYS